MEKSQGDGSNERKNGKSLLCATIAALFLFFFPSFVFAQTNAAATYEPITIAVLNFRTDDAHVEQANPIATYIGNELATKKALRISERRRINTITASGEPCADKDCALDIGKRLGVRKVIWGMLTYRSDGYVLAATMADVETGQSEGAVELAIDSSDIELSSKITAFVLIKNMSGLKEVEEAIAAEEAAIAAEQKKQAAKIGRFSLAVGGESNLLSTSGIAVGGVLAADYRYSKAFAFGIKTGAYSGSGVNSFEGAAFGRWYFSILPRLWDAEFFAQAELGAVILKMDYEKTVPAALGGIAAGARIPFADNWFAEPYIRAGYPHAAGIGVMVGVRI
jgi:hypothetical protein